MSEAELVAQALDDLSRRSSRPGIYGYMVSDDGHYVIANMRAGGYREVLVVIWNGKAHAQLKKEVPIHAGRIAWPVTHE